MALVNKYSISEDDYRMMEVAIIENKPHKAGPQWKFAGAFYFSTVVLAMIGKSIIITFFLILGKLMQKINKNEFKINYKFNLVKKCLLVYFL